MAGFEVRISIEVLAAGCRLVERGQQPRPPEIELEPDESWRAEVDKFCARTLGEIPRHLELLDAESGRDGLFPVLRMMVRCYLAEMKPPLDGQYRWARTAKESDGEKPRSGGTLDPETDVLLYTDGGSRGNPGPAGTGALLIQEANDWSEEHCRYLGEATNNQAEYIALLDGLRLALQRGIRHIVHRADSQLIVRQLQGAYKVKSPELKGLFDQAKDLISAFESFRTEHIPREQNRRADELANRAMDEAGAVEQ